MDVGSLVDLWAVVHSKLLLLLGAFYQLIFHVLVSYFCNIRFDIIISDTINKMKMKPI